MYKFIDQHSSKALLQVREGESIDFHQPSLFDDKEFLVYKRNELIHAKFDLSLIAQKTMAALIAKIDPNQKNLPVFEFNVSEFAILLGVSRQRIYKCIDEITTELQSQVVKIQVRELEKDVNKRHQHQKSFDKFNWFEVSSYRGNEGVVRFKFNERMTPYLLDFNGNFTRYALPKVLSMKSKYSIRLYEIFRSFLAIYTPTNNQTEVYRTIQLDDLREMLGLTKETLSKIGSFERLVLKQAKKELDSSDLSFNYTFPERKKSSRAKVTKIFFCIYHQNVNINIVKGDWLSLLKQWTRENVANRLLQQYGDEHVKRNIEFISSQIENGSNIKNMVAYVTSAIQSDYASSTPLNPPASKKSTRKAITEAVMDIQNTNW